MELSIPKDKLKAVVKESLAESITNHKQWFTEIFQDAIENYGLGKAMEEGLKSDYISKEEVFATLQDIRAYDEAKAEENEVIPFEQAIEEIDSQFRERTRTETATKGGELRSIMKNAMTEGLIEHRDWLTEILYDVIEDYSVGKAMQEAMKNEAVSEEEALAALRNTN